MALVDTTTGATMPRIESDHPLRPGQPVLYFMSGLGGRSLYVGQTTNIARRLMEHRRSPWFADVDEICVYRCESQDHAKRSEARLIRRLNPILNVQHRPGPLSPEDVYALLVGSA